MITQQDVKDWLCDNGHEDAIVFENPDFRQAFIGVDSDGRAVYDYDMMVRSLMEEDGMDEIDAIEFIEYNTIRALPYMGNMAPIVVHRIEEE